MKPKSTLTSPYITRQEAAEYLRYSLSRFDRLLAADKLPRPFRPGPGRLLWRVAELDEWLIAGCPDGETWERTHRATPK